MLLPRQKRLRELTKHQVAVYYFAGTTRIAMRKYTIPQNMTVEYFLTDHLGSTSLTTDSNGAKVSEMRYKPCPLRYTSGMLREGEVRYAWTASLTTTPAYRLSDYTFTGQFSYMDDPSTAGVTEGFGLMFYNARWYDPVNGRFAQADSIVPGGVQGWDRYAYVNNAPTRFTDPSGHLPIDDECGYQGQDCGSPLPAQPMNEYNSGNIASSDASTDNNESGGILISSTGNSNSARSTITLFVSANNLPYTIVMHPSDGNVLGMIPVYDYRNGRKVLVGYVELYYAFDYSTAVFDRDSTGNIPWLIPVTYETLKFVAKRLGFNFICPGCDGTLWVWTVADGINDSTTIEGHLQVRFLDAVRRDFYSPDYSPFCPTYTRSFCSPSFPIYIPTLSD
ncbi:MAG: RHS repeat-associated core domain-containing protein [Chloroflexota bacterium]